MGVWGARTPRWGKEILRQQVRYLPTRPLCATAFTAAVEKGRGPSAEGRTASTIEERPRFRALGGRATPAIALKLRPGGRRAGGRGLFPGRRPAGAAHAAQWAAPLSRPAAAPPDRTPYRTRTPIITWSPAALLPELPRSPRGSEQSDSPVTGSQSTASRVASIASTQTE
ncbi:hypothetical protein VTN96DRAFT_4704 [Rasamsonia emersonii]